MINSGKTVSMHSAVDGETYVVSSSEVGARQPVTSTSHALHSFLLQIQITFYSNGQLLHIFNHAQNAIITNATVNGYRDHVNFTSLYISKLFKFNGFSNRIL